MGFEQTVILPRVLLPKLFNPTPNAPGDSHVPAMSLRFQPLTLKLSSLSSSSHKSTRLIYCRPISYSNDYHNGNNSDAVVFEYNQLGASQYPRPSEIQWKKELCNSVQLIGIVAVPVQIKHLPSGKTVAWTRLAVKKSASETTWINVNVWNELAHVAFQHVEKGCQIYISGRLVSDTVEGDDGKQQTYYKVVAQEINFIERNSSSPVPLYDGESNPMTSGTKPKNFAANSTGTVEELWQAFFANPMEWWDNRRNKRSPNYPDFKHKSTGESLWVEGRNNPPWVKSQLAILDSRMEALEGLQNQVDSARLNFMTVDNHRPL
ncbi:unnamed protein product [Cuscuta epithymum]|uniref:Uncharacterized protein n=1 Tax=Cuscuta epithymum TaxID=186058 RepID=A0AAV0CFL3_9ASTE|nr:unnamed protein product [Cuscuta epithymum]